MRALLDRVTGLLKLPWPRRTTVLVGSSLVVVVALVVTGVVLVNRKPERPPPPPPALALRPLAVDAPTPTNSGLATALNKAVNASALGTLTGEVTDPATGKVLWSRNPDKPLTPGSAFKLLTMAAVLLTVDPSTRLTTRVVAGDTPDSVILVGGGDPTLSSLPKDRSSVYPGAAKLDTLVATVKNAHPDPIRTVSVDTSLFDGDTMAPGWLKVDIKDGNFTPIGPLILDGGRSKPDEDNPPRTPTPAEDAGKLFAQRVGADPTKIETRVATHGAPVLGEISSPPIGDLVDNALRISDNVLAESLARQVALARGADPSFDGAAKAVHDTLAEAGFDLTGVKVVDGSGLSTEDRASAKLLGQIVAVASGPVSDPRAARLRPLLAGLPVAGGDGTLAARFTGEAADARGLVRAKTGTLTGVSSLAGMVTDSDGRVLTFALMSNGTSPADARPKLDAIASVLRNCGCK